MNQPNPDLKPQGGGSWRLVLGVIVVGVLLYRALLSGLDAQAMRDMRRLSSNVQVSLDRLRSDTAGVAWWLASHPDARRAALSGDVSGFRALTQSALEHAGIARVTLWDAAGMTLLDMPAGMTGAVPITAVVRSALQGRPLSGIEDEPAATSLVLRAACPVQSGTGVVGAVRVDLNCFGSHSFVDDVNRQFDIACSVFREALRISTTITDEGSRFVDSTLANPDIIHEVLEKGQVFSGRNRVLDRECDTVYWALKDADANTVGMVGIARDRKDSEETTNRVVGALALLAVIAWGAVVAFRRAWRLQSLVLLVALPALLLVTAVVGVWMYRDLYDGILAGFDRKLLALNTSVGACLDGDELLRVLEDQEAENPMFLRFARPLRTIQRAKEVTYLYTFLLGGKKDITYIVDASPGDDYCPIGLEEYVPPQNLEGLRRAVRDGVPYVGAVQEYERWGLLKVSAAPIPGADGRVRALSGVDINVSVINRKTQLAVFEILGIGALALLMAGLVSWRIARRIKEPIDRLKEGALRVAAGQYTHVIDVAHPRELHILATAFNRISGAIDRTLNAAVRDHENTETVRCNSDLAKWLAAETDRGQTGSVQWRWVGGRADCSQASGCAAQDMRALFWQCESTDDVLDAVALRRRIAQMADGVLSEVDPEHAAAELVRLSPVPLRHVAAADMTRGTVRVLGERPLVGVHFSSAGTATVRNGVDGQVVELQPGESLVVVVPGPGGEAAAIAGWETACAVTSTDLPIDRVVHAIIRTAGNAMEGSGVLVTVFSRSRLP